MKGLYARKRGDDLPDGMRRTLDLHDERCTG
jgi:hypothetical protein